MPRKLGRTFFSQPCLQVARQLIGKYLVHDAGDMLQIGRIVETEAYIGTDDAACHARFGAAGRAKPLFGPPGHAYVYLIYGMYHCLNVVTEKTGQPAAVLIRALEPVAGIDGTVNGPGKICRAMNINRNYNNLDLTTGKKLYFETRELALPKIVTTPRIGIDYAGLWAKKPWRFVAAESLHLSRKLK